MRDTYVLILFVLFLICGTFLAYSGKVEPQLVLTPIVTGFLGLLASTKQASKPPPSPPSDPPAVEKKTSDDPNA